MNNLLNVLKRADKVVLNLLRAFTITVFFFISVLITLNVVVRFIPVASLHWFDEIVEMLYAYLVFYGAAALWITGEHFSVGNWIGKRVIKSPRMAHLYRLVLEIMVLVFVVIFFYYSLRLTNLAHDVTNVFAIPKKILYSCLPASGLIMILYSIRNIVVQLRGVMEPEKEGEAEV